MTENSRTTWALRVRSTIRYAGWEAETFSTAWFSRRFLGVPPFFNGAIADGIYNLLFPDKRGIRKTPRAKEAECQLSFGFREECALEKLRKLQ